MSNKMINTITQGDCLEVMRDISDKSVDMILCDLPYGTTAAKWDSVIPFEPLWEQYERIIKDNGAVVLTAIEPFASKLRLTNLDMYRHEWIWDKQVAGNFIQAKNHPLRVQENVLVFSKKRVNYYPIMTDADPKNIRPTNTKKQNTEFLGKVSDGEFKPSDDYNPKKRYPKSIITFNARSAECNNVNRVHPTQKPVALFEYLIRTYTNEGEVVLDNCIGSGTTAVAAINTVRNFIGIEKEPEYVEIARRRVDEALAIKNEKESDN